jgi:two-component system, chemotaxis family, chemotaxis protein CheY
LSFTVTNGGAHPVLSKPICLLIDDSDVIRKVMRLTIEDLGYQVDEAPSTNEALARCRMAMPSLVVLDWHIPGSSTLEFLAAFRSMAGAQNVKVLYVVTNNDPVDIGRAIASGANDHMMKPFARVTLETKIAQLMTTTQIVGTELDTNIDAGSDNWDFDEQPRKKSWL